MKLYNVLKKGILLVLGLMFIPLFVGFLNSEKVFADSADYFPYLPNSDMEVFDFGEAPKCVSIYDQGASVILSDNSLWVYNGENYVKHQSLTGNNPIQIEYCFSDTLLINDNNILYFLDLENLSLSPTALTINSQIITCEYFDYSNGCILVRNGNKLSICKLNGKAVLSLTELSVEAKVLSPVAIDENNVFFIRSTDSYLCKYDLETGETVAIFNPQGEINNFISLSEKVIFVNGGKIYQVDQAENSTPSLLEVKDQTPFEIGNVNFCLNVSLFGDKIVVIDGEAKAIETFSLTDGKLDFTGFSIAKNKTAYNRISENVKSVSRYKENVCVLDDKKLTVVKDDNADYFDKERYFNVTSETLLFPISSEIGEDYILLSYSDGLRLYNLKTNTLGNLIEISNVIALKYNCGEFYVLSGNSETSLVNKVNTGENSLMGVAENQFPCTDFAVDFNGNIAFLSGDTVKADQDIISTGITAISIDLFGNLFGVKEDGVYFLTTEKVWEKKAEISGISLFTMDFDSEKVFFVKENALFVTTSLQNACVSGFEIPNGFNDSYQSAIDFLSVKIDNAVKVNLSETAISYDFTPKTLEEEYIFISALTFNGVNGEITAYLLAGKEGYFLTDGYTENQIESLEYPSCVYLITKTNAYYIPLITKDGRHSVLTQTGKLVFAQNTVLYPTDFFEFGGTAYYKVSLEEGGTTYYVPKLFTKEFTNNQVESKSYAIESAKNTTLYSDSELSSELMKITEGTKIRVYEKAENYYAVSVYNDGGWVYGFISVSSIYDAPNLSIRNILVVIAVFASVCGSASYFLLRKKEN